MSKNSREELAKGLISGSVKWEDFLRFSSNLFSYSFDDMTEIYAQNKNVVALADFDTWKNLGFSVKLGEHGLRLSPLSNGRKRVVFDITQTTAPEEFGRWTYKPEADDYIRTEWNKSPAYDIRSNDIKEAIISFAYTSLDYFKQRYPKIEFSSKLETLLTDSVAYSMMYRLDLAPQEMNFDFSGLQEELNGPFSYNEYAFDNLGKFYTLCIRNGLYGAKAGILRYDEYLSQQLAEEEKKIADREMFTELSTSYNNETPEEEVQAATDGQDEIDVQDEAAEQPGDDTQSLLDYAMQAAETVAEDEEPDEDVQLSFFAVPSSKTPTKVFTTSSATDKEYCAVLHRDSLSEGISSAIIEADKARNDETAYIYGTYPDYKQAVEAVVAFRKEQERDDFDAVKWLAQIPYRKRNISLASTFTHEGMLWRVYSFNKEENWVDGCLERDFDYSVSFIQRTPENAPNLTRFTYDYVDGLLNLPVEEYQRRAAKADVRPEFDPELFGALFRSGQHLNSSKNEVVAYFADNHDNAFRINYVSELYDHGIYTEILVGSDNTRVGYIADDDGMTVWEGSYLSRTSESRLSWEEVTMHITALVMNDSYLNTPQNFLEEDHSVNFSIVTLNGEKEFFAAGFINEETIKDTEEYQAYTSEWYGNLQVECDYYNVGEGESDDASLSELTYIKLHFSELREQAVLLESNGFSISSSEDYEEIEETAPVIERAEIPSVKNLSQLKKALAPGMEFEITDHLKPERIGERRRITSVNTVGFTSKVINNDGEAVGRDIYMDWDKAANWRFEGNNFTQLMPDESVVMTFHLVNASEPEQIAEATITENNAAEPVSAPEISYITLHKVGDFYEIWGDQATLVADLLNLHLSRRNNEPMVGFPVHSKDNYTDRLSAEGYSVLIEEAFSLRPRSNVVDYTANRNYRHLLAAFPAMMEQQYDYMQFSGGEAFDKLNLEWISSNRLAISQTFVQNGDLMRDPDVVLLVSRSNQMVQPVEYQNDLLGLYGSYEAGDKNSIDCNEFVKDWLRNIDAQGYCLIRTVRRTPDGVDIDKDYNNPLNEVRYDLYYDRQSAGIEVYNRLDITENTPIVKHRHTATITFDGNVTYHDNSVPDTYRAEISNYSRRLNVDYELFAAFALREVFRDIKRNKDISERYDLTALSNICESSTLYDRDFKEFIKNALFASDTYEISDDDLVYAAEIITNTINHDYVRIKGALNYVDASSSFVKDEELEANIFTQLFTHLDTVEIAEQTVSQDTSLPGVDQDSIIPEPEPEVIMPEFSVGDHLEYNGKEYKVESLDVNGFITLADTALDNSPRLVSRVTFLTDEFLRSSEYRVITPAETDTIQDEVEVVNPLGLKVGDLVNAGGSDREFVITEINEESGIATIRDDNTGWYPVFQDVPIWKLSAIVERAAIQDSYENSIQISDNENAAQLGNYHITNDDLGVGGPKTKAAANIAAIEIINELGKEKRNATEEERAILAGYVGWGSLPDVFDERKDNFSSERARLQELLSEKEYQSARESTLTAFYTQPVIIRSIYTALESFGFDGGKILEPAMGVGNFFGAMPQEMAEKSKLHGVEVDRITGNIAKQLYPNADISVKGFEDYKAADNSFDVAIGNVPFADFKVFDPRYNKHNLLIHDYFFAKSVDKVKPGGIVAFITSKGTLDKQNSKFRQMLCEKAELIGAIRLPSNAFKANAGTEAISDIIFLKKRESIQAVRDNWVDVTYSDVTNSFINNYYIEHPDMICGELSTQSTQFGYDIDVKPFEDITLEEALAERIAKLQGKFEPIERVADLEAQKETKTKYISLIDDSIPRECYGQLPDGTIVHREGDKLKVLDVSPKTKKQYEAAIRLSRAVRNIINVQQEIPDGFNDDIIERNFEFARAELNEAYDKFAALGLRAHDTSRRSFKITDDYNYNLMCALETQETNPDGSTKWVKDSPLFERRTIIKHKEITHCETLSDAFLVCLNVKSRIDLDYISSLTDKSVDEVITELDGSFMYRNPEKFDAEDKYSGWETADEYLSGNIRAKLQRAKDAAVNDKQFEKNITALENVMPEKIPASEITVQLGSSWVPQDVIESFLYETFNTPSWMKMYIKVEHDVATASWYIKAKKYAHSLSSVRSIYGSEDRDGLEVLEDCLNMRQSTIYDRVEDADGRMKSVKNAKKTAEIRLKQDALKQAFVDWVYKDPERTRRLETIYNTLYNSERVRRFDGSHLTFDDMNAEIKLLPHQKNAVARVLYGGNSLLAHVVGAGKTFEIAACCMELKRTGAANKSLIVAPNHLLGQWQKEFMTLYPSANILVASSKDFQKQNRKKFFARMATGDYDAIIMGYSTFSKIAVSPERRKKYYNEELESCIEHLNDVTKDSLSEKQLQKYKKEIEAKLKSMEYVVRQDDELYFEELGVDWLYVDEAHNFKNLAMQTKLGRVAGVQTSKSKRAEDMLLKIRYINELQGGERGVVLATGTPISNSLVEMYTMQRYLQPEYLKSKGIGHFDAWAADFAKIETSIELNPTGVGFRSKTRCASFNNLPELMVMFNRCTDIQTAEMLDLPVPKLQNGQYSIYIAHPTDDQKAFIKRCGERAEKIHNKMVDPSSDNMLCVTNDGKLCALDMRLVDPDAEDFPDSKINIAVNNIYNKWAETNEKRLTQVVFLDRSTPKPDEFNLYDDIRDKLVARGVPREEIRYIHEAKTDDEKLKLFDQVNSGKVRVIIGSTEKMGAGTNIQTKLCALHHLDVPWRPSDIEQREGRILRRGNENNEVEIFRYVTEGTFDAYSWQTIESKQRFISQVMTGEAAGRSAEDVDDAVLNYAEIKALATGDPRIREHFDLTEEVNKLKLLKGNFDKAHIEMRDRLAFALPKQLQKELHFVQLFKAEKEYALENGKPYSEDNPFSMTIGGVVYTERDKVGEKVQEIINSGVASNDEYKLGKYRGFDLSVKFNPAEADYNFYLRHECTLSCVAGESAIGMFVRLDNLIDKRIDKQLVEHSQLLTATQKEIENCQAHANEEFPQAEQLREKSKRLETLTKELAFDNHNEGAELIEQDDPIIEEKASGRR